MKKKILLLVSLFALLACIFAVVVGAAGVATDEFGVAETLENIPVDLTDTTSRVVLKGADGLYRTFPSSYIYFKTGSGNWNWRGEAKCNFEHLNSALGLTEENAYTIDSVVRIEVPDDLRYFEGYNGKTNLKEIYFSKTSEMTNLRPVGQSGLVKITMPPKQNSFAEYMFHTCSNLTTVIFYENENENLVSLPKEMFKACTALKEFTVPSSVTTIGNSAFISCTALESIDLGNVTKIDDNAFRSSGLTSIIIPSSVTSIGNYAFHSAKLTSLVFESRTSELSLGNVGVFQSCTSLASITLTEGITAIGQDCFNSAPIVTFVLPDSVTEIKNSAFANCKKLTTFTINPTSNLKTLGSQVFKDGISLTSFYFPNSLTSIGSNLFIYNNGSLKEIINFENCGVTSIPEGVFSQCSGLTEVKFPYGVTEINGKDLLKWADLDSITLPQTLTTISNSITCDSIGKIIFAAPDGTPLPANAPSTTVEYANYCETYFAGAHKETGEATYVWLDKDGNAGEAFLSYLKVACPCGRSCGKETVIDTLAPLFVDRGFAYGASSMLQGVAVDRELLDEYGKYFTGIKYGLVAAAKSAQASASIIDTNGVGVNGYVAAVDYTERDYDLFEMNLCGISESYKATEFYFGAYVIADGQVYYIHNGTTNNEAQAIAYDDVVVIVDALVPEKEEE